MSKWNIPKEGEKMKTIHKYQMKDLVSPVMMPEGAEILAIQLQDSMICIWAMVDKDAQMIERYIVVCGTGQKLPEDMRGYKYITTLQMNVYVWHLFEKVL